MNHIGDLTRIITRINYSSTANARDLLNIKNGLQICKEIKQRFSDCEDSVCQALIARLEDFDELIALIDRSIADSTSDYNH